MQNLSEHNILIFLIQIFLLLGLAHPVVVFSRSAGGIEWNSPDGKLSHFIFLILTPKEDDAIQVQVLRIIAKAMSDKQAQSAIMSAGNQEEVWQALQKFFTVHQVVRKKG